MLIVSNLRRLSGTMLLISWIIAWDLLKLATATSCIFPPEWQGLWYDSGLKEVRITSTSISGKGTCVQKDGNKYLLRNQMKSSIHTECFTCIVFHPWHLNLLQYKESHCWQEESVSIVCGKITSENPLVTVVKVRSIPIPCPFHGSYTFSYINGTGSVECRQPPSRIRACADESRFRFVYKQCNNIPGTSNQELEFQCLATWESGDKFLYGKFEKPNSPDSEPSYRCFMHSFYGTYGDMSMSADGTCQGLQSASLGVLTMKLSKDRGSRGSCNFPKFLIRHTQWRDMTGQYRLEVDDGLQVVKVKNRQRSDIITYTEAQPSSVTRLLFRCVQDLGNAELIRQSHPDSESQHFIAFTTDDNCVSEDKCLLFNKRSDDIIEMIIGTSDENFKLSCNYEDGEHFLFIPETLHNSVCPSLLSGEYAYTDRASECTGTVKIGCSQTDEILIQSSCSANRQSVKILKCLYSWEEGSTTFSIVKHLGDDKDTQRCLTFIRTEFGINVQESPNCEGDKTVVTNKYLNYLLYTPKETCKVKVEETPSDQKPEGSDKKNGDGLIQAHDGRDTAAAAPTYLSLYILAIYSIVLVLVQYIEWT